MRLSFSGSNEVTAPRLLVWQRLLDPQFVAASAPGVEKVEQVDDSHFQVFLGVGLGAIKVHFTLGVELLDVVPPEKVTMRAHGKAPGIWRGHDDGDRARRVARRPHDDELAFRL